MQDEKYSIAHGRGLLVEGTRVITSKPLMRAYAVSSEADLIALAALSPLDGRYAAKVAALSPHFSEYGLVRHRIRVELSWLVALADEAAIAELPPFSTDARKAIDDVANGFSPADAV